MQPKNRPENLTPPHKGPSYCPKEKETKVIIEVLKSEEETKVKWHPYPKKMPDIAGGEKYLVTIKYKRKAKIKIMESGERGCFTPPFFGKIIAWAELPKPYEGGK